MSERNPFRPALVIGLITAGLLSFAAFIALLGWGRHGPSPSAFSAPSTSAVGFEGLKRLAGRFVPVETVGRDADLDSYELLVVPLRAFDEREDVEKLLARRSGQSTLLILPKWAVIRDRERSGWVRALGPWEGGEGNRLLGRGFRVEALSGTPRPAQGVGLLDGMEVPLPAEPQVIHSDADMLLGVPGEGSLIVQLGEQPHYVAADPDLFNNHGLRSPATAQAAVEILTILMPLEDGTIYFSEAGAQGVEPPRGRNLVRSMFEPPFLAMTIALLAAALLAGLHGAGRFGPARRPARAIPFGKAALVENSAGLVRLAGREVRLGGGYADMVRDEAARAGAAPPNLSGEALEAYLDRFTKPGETPFRPLAEAVRTAPDRGQLVAAARALFRWKKDMIR
jgi:hypothetical protein